MPFRHQHSKSAPPPAVEVREASSNLRPAPRVAPTLPDAVKTLLVQMLNSDGTHPLSPAEAHLVEPVCLGGWLLKWRKARNRSRDAVAVQANLSSIELARWEMGVRLPTAAQFQILLKALRPRMSEKKAAYRALTQQSGRRAASLTRTRSSPSAPPKIAPIILPQSVPLRGDLLRAMRWRCGLSQTEAAYRIGVTQGTLARWERSENWPQGEQIQSLCFVLRAHPQEVAGLLTGRFLPDLQLESRDGSSGGPALLARIEQRLHEAQTFLDEGRPFPLGDLSFLAMRSVALSVAQKQREAVTLLARICVSYAQFLTREWRPAAHIQYQTRWLLDLADTHAIEFVPLDCLLTAGVLSAQATARSLPEVGRRPSEPRQSSSLYLALRQLRKLLPLAQERPARDHQAWILMQMASLYARQGQAEAAITLCARSNAVPGVDGSDRQADPEARICSARVLVRVGHPGAALDVLDSALSCHRTGSLEAQAHPYLRARLSLARAETLFAMHREPAALGWLFQAKTMTCEEGLHGLAGEVHRLTERFTAA